jgi:predicted amidophosphoribosyltransferase
MAKPMIPDVLIKKKWTISQIGLSKSKRSKNLNGSIKLGDKHSVNGKTILLVDDVKTTGATSNLCSQVLKNAGAASVTLVTISLA